MKILEAMWYGDTELTPKAYSTTDKATNLAKLIQRNRQELCDTLTDKQKETFEKYIDCVTELTSEENKNIFIYAFKLGAQLTAECLTEDLT